MLLCKVLTSPARVQIKTLCVLKGTIRLSYGIWYRRKKKLRTRARKYWRVCSLDPLGFRIKCEKVREAAPIDIATKYKRQICRFTANY